MPDTVAYEIDGEVYQVPYLLTLTPMEQIAHQFDEWAKTQPAPAASVAEGWASPPREVKKIASVVRVTQEMIEDQGPSLDQLMRMAQKAQVARHVANQRELRWQDREDWDNPAVERGYN
jgi:hypothetical protein